MLRNIHRKYKLMRYFINAVKITIAIRLRFDATVVEVVIVISRECFGCIIIGTSALSALQNVH